MISASLPVIFAKTFSRWTFALYSRLGFEMSEDSLVVIFRLIGIWLISFEIWTHFL